MGNEEAKIRRERSRGKDGDWGREGERRRGKGGRIGRGR